KNGIVTAAGNDRRRAVPGVEHHSEHQKQRELQKYNHAAGEQREFAFALGLSGKEPLHDGLIRSVASHRKKSAANYAGPKRVEFSWIRQTEREIENLKLVRRGRGLGNRRPSS